MTSEYRLSASAPAVRYPAGKGEVEKDLRDMVNEVLEGASGVREVEGGGEREAEAGHLIDPEARKDPKISEYQAILLLAHIMLIGVGSALLSYGSINELWSMVYGGIGLIALSAYDLIRRRRSTE